MYRLAQLLGILASITEVWSLSQKDRTALFEDCSIFNNTNLYSGPVCGDDGRTYANSLFLDCLNYYGLKNVAVMHSGECLPGEENCEVDLRYEPICGSDGNTYTNARSLACIRYKHRRNVTVSSNGECNKNDNCYRRGTEFYGMNPVCGNNGFTYQNAGQVKCLQRYNADLKIVHDGGCLAQRVHSLYTHKQTLCRIARTRYEWNPVCASDGVTYPNPFVFLCYKSNLKVIYNGECNTQSHESCTEAYGKNSMQERIDEGVVHENEVCGSDGRTYQSAYHLMCQTRRNKYLFVKHDGRCFGPDDNPCGSIPEEDHRIPVCGNDGVSYISPEALWCARTRSSNNDLIYVHDGPC